MVRPDVEVQDGVVETWGTGAGRQVGVRRDPDEGVVRAGLGLEGCHEGRSPWGRVGTWDDGDAVGLIRPRFQEREAEEVERWGKQDNSGRKV